MDGLSDLGIYWGNYSNSGKWNDDVSIDASVIDRFIRAVFQCRIQSCRMDISR